MANINMGTPGQPEGVPHWTTKEAVGHDIRNALLAADVQQPPTANYFDNRMVETIAGCLPEFMVNYTTANPFYYLTYNEPPHDGCNGGAMVVDIVREAESVEIEGWWWGLRPDISVYGTEKGKPAVVIETVDTSEPSPRKLAQYQDERIESYRLDTRDLGVPAKQTLKYGLLLVDPLTHPRCGKRQRNGIAKMIADWDRGSANGLLPFLGYAEYESGVLEYAYGCSHDWLKKHDAPSSYNLLAWPRWRGIQRNDVDWGRPDSLIGDSMEFKRTVNRDEWFDAVAYLRGAAAAQFQRGELNDTLMMAIAKYGLELMRHA